MTEKQFRAIHEEIISQYPLKIQLELSFAREKWMATNRRLDITTSDELPVEEVE